MTENDSVTPEIAAFLRSKQAAEAMTSLSAQDLHPSRTISTLEKLRKSFSAEQAGSLLTLARLRVRAETKFPLASQMFLTTEALEQATAWPVALHHAKQLDENAPPGPVLDLGCGIGGDTLALAEVRNVIAIERNAVRLAFAQENVDAAQLSHRVEFIHADWTALQQAAQLPDAAAAFVDPARRIDGRRVFSLHQIEPPIQDILPLLAAIPIVAVKVMPSVQDDELPDDCGVEFISHDGVCKEAVLWLGAEAPHGRRASVYDGQQWHTLSAEGASPPVGTLQPDQFLYEPDPAVIRAGAFAELCHQLDAALIDPLIAYLVADKHLDTPFATAFHIREVHPFNLKLLNQRLQALQIGSVELKKRSAPFEPESLRSRLKLAADGDTCTILFTRLEQDPIMILAWRV